MVKLDPAAKKRVVDAFSRGDKLIIMRADLHTSDGSIYRVIKEAGVGLRRRKNK